ncbi:MAG: siderophore-interacting protein [Pseudomonadota bacterium]
MYELTVRSNTRLTPHMRRIVLEGASLAEFPEDQESGYVKLFFPNGNADKPILRSYTIRSFDAADRAITLDFVDHGDTGPASAWANHAEPGDPMTIRGPGEKKLAAADADWFLLAGDMSALPALAVNLEQLPDHATGYAAIEVLSEEDKQPLRHPAGIDVRWLVNPDNEAENSKLFDLVASLPWLEGTPYPWYAGEFNTMRRIRRYFRDERGIDKRAMYVSSYWKIGDSDEGMKLAKRNDPEA